MHHCIPIYWDKQMTQATENTRTQQKSHMQNMMREREIVEKVTLAFYITVNRKQKLYFHK